MAEAEKFAEVYDQTAHGAIMALVAFLEGEGRSDLIANVRLLGVRRHPDGNVYWHGTSHPILNSGVGV